MSITIENETHWKSSDIMRIVRAALAASGAEPDWQERLVQARWSSGLDSSRSSVKINAGRDRQYIVIRLPKKGPKNPHSNAMLALAAATIEADTTMLAVSESYRVANRLAYEFSNEIEGGSALWDDLWTVKNSINPPEWGDATKLIITKYKDPRKDGTYLDFVTKKKVVISRAEKTVERETGIIAKARHRLDNAEKRKRKAEQALRSALERRQ